MESRAAPGVREQCGDPLGRSRHRLSGGPARKQALMAFPVHRPIVPIATPVKAGTGSAASPRPTVMAITAP
jgi:hypothetical protein